MKKSIVLGLCLLVLLCLVPQWLPAKEKTGFSAAGLQAYADAALPGSMDVEGTAWAYTIGGAERMQKIHCNAFDGELGFFYGLTGADDEGHPFMTMTGTGNQKWTVQKAEALVNHNVYTIHFPTNQGFTYTSGVPDGGYTYSTTIYMGTQGVAFLKDLKEAGGAMTLRVYYKDKTYFEMTYPATQQYEAFFNGLYEAGYLDANGTAAPNVLKGLSVISKKSAFGKVKVHAATADNWPVEEMP